MSDTNEPEAPGPDTTTVQQAQALIVAVGKYAVAAGEEWRTGPGAEIMDAYQGLSGDASLRRYLNALALAKQEGYDEGRMSVFQEQFPNE